MAYICVDHSKFEGTASEIDKYVSLMKNKMKSAQGEVDALAASWQGSDFSQFEAQFNKLDNSDSTHRKMLKALESYSNFLRYAEAQYKEAQSKAVNRANLLPRY